MKFKNLQPIYPFYGFHLSILLIFAFTFTACLFSKEKIMARVGYWTITETNLNQKHQVNQVLQPEISADKNLELLKVAYKKAMLVDKWGYKISNEALKQWEILALKKIENRQSLNLIKNIFGHETEDYYKVFILPYYVDQYIQDNFYLKELMVQNQNRKDSNSSQSYEDWINAQLKP